MKKKIAVIGGGISGITAAYYASREADVTLFESSSSLGGHAHAEWIVDSAGLGSWVDTAFLIFNEHTYPVFLQLLEDLELRGSVGGSAISAEMSSCFSDPSRDLHFTLGGGWAPFKSHPRNYLRKELVLIARDLILFRKRASRDLDEGKNLSGITAGEYLASYSRTFVENFIWPLTAAIWSLPATELEKYPIAALLQYFSNHQLLKGRSPKKWKTFFGSSRNYVEAFRAKFNGEIRLNTPVTSVSRSSVGVEIFTDRTEHFDCVILATHADVTAKILKNPTSVERQIFSKWRYQDNPVTLHRDVSVLHESSAMWGSWNMRREEMNGYRISYYLNRLQQINSVDPLVLTLGDADFAPEKILKRFSYRHPIFDTESVATQTLLSELSGTDRIFFCGSYFGFGFHEDGARSGKEAALKALRS